MILNLLNRNSSYGYELTNKLRSISPVNESSVYTMLKELSEKELVTSQIKIIQGKLRRYYSITSSGRMVISQKNQVLERQLNDIYEIIKDVS